MQFEFIETTKSGKRASNWNLSIMYVGIQHIKPLGLEIWSRDDSWEGLFFILHSEKFFFSALSRKVSRCGSLALDGWSSLYRIEHFYAAI